MSGKEDIGVILKKFNAGAALTDDEVTQGWRHFSDLANLLGPLGPVFDLAWREAYNIARRLKEIKDARSGNQGL